VGFNPIYKRVLWEYEHPTLGKLTVAKGLVTKVGNRVAYVGFALLEQCFPIAFCVFFVLILLCFALRCFALLCFEHSTLGKLTVAKGLVTKVLYRVVLLLGLGLRCVALRCFYFVLRCFCVAFTCFCFYLLLHLTCFSVA
jgi:hypothetical protein